MSFGTGHHQTTHMMVQFVLDLELKGKTLLDMGCGTGVLAILAAQRGAVNVEAIDIDEWAVENTLENAGRNGMPISTEKGGAERLNGKLFDVILANINKNILLQDMKFYSAALKNNGSIVFSGFYTHDLRDIEKAANQFGLVLQNVKERNNWQAAQFVKTGG
jgi:ribosomal protein L11 methyltransferase